MFASFVGSLHGRYVLDDHFLVERVPGAGMREGLTAAFTRDVQSFQSGARAPALYYRPLTLASYVLDHALWRGHPSPSHAENLVVHLVVALLAFSLALRLIASPWVAAGVVALWAVHPITSESVAWISGRTDALAGLGMLAAIRAALEARDSGRARWWWVAAAATWLACLAKEIAVATPLLVALAIPLARGRNDGRSRLSRREWTFLLAPVALFLAQRAVVLGALLPAGVSFAERSAAFRSGLLGAAYATRSLVWPVGLVGDIEVSPPAWSDPRVLAGAILIVAVLVALVALWRRGSPAAGTLAAALLVGLPASGLVTPLPIPVALRYFHLPALGLALTAGILLARRLPGVAARRALALSVFGIAVAALLPLTVARNAEYRDDPTFYRAVIAHADRAGFGIQPGYWSLVNLGHLEAVDGRLDEAEVLTRRAIAEKPAAPLAWNHLGNVLAIQGETDRALEAWRHAVTLDPRAADPWLNLGLTLDHLGRRAEAIVAYRAALEAGLPPPRRGEVEARLGALEREGGRPAGAP